MEASRTDPRAETAGKPNCSLAFEEAFAHYQKAVWETWRSLYGMVEDAGAERARTLRNAFGKPDEEKCVGDANTHFLKAVNHAWTSTEQNLRQNYDGYLNALKSAWANLDVTSVDAASLSLIGQSMAAAAVTVSCSGASPHLVALAHAAAAHA